MTYVLIKLLNIIISFMTIIELSLFALFIITCSKFSSEIKITHLRLFLRIDRYDFNDRRSFNFPRRISIERKK